MALDRPPSPIPPASPAGAPFAAVIAAIGVIGASVLLALAVADPDYARRDLLGAGAVALLAVIVCLALFLMSPRVAPGLSVFEAADDATEAAATPWRTALELLPDPVLVVVAADPDDYAGLRIAFANVAARELLRIPREGVLLITALRDPEVLEIADEALFGGKAASAAFETGGARDRFWRAWARPLPTADGAERMALLVLRDETDARSMERMRADFLANASHELRTPLASLTGFIETLKGHARDDPEARDRFLEIMAVQAGRMARLIADLLSLSRIELNEHVPPSGQADLSLIIGDVIDALTPLAQQAQVTISCTLPAAGEARVVGDRDQIVQVVQNLVDNAIKYSPKGAAVELELVTAATLDDAISPQSETAPRMSLLQPNRDEAVRYVLLRVRDHGPGLARQHLPRLTERFYRVEGQKSGERLGTGLGLAIVKHIANRHRGGLSVESDAGSGALFSVYFPQSEVPAARVEAGAALSEPSAALTSPLVQRNKSVAKAS